MPRYDEKLVREQIEDEEVVDAFLNAITLLDYTTKEDIAEIFRRILERWEHDFYAD